VKSQKESNDHLKTATESLDNIADTGKKALQDAAEAKREAKVGGSGGANELKPDGDKKDDDKKEKKEKKQSINAMTAFNKSLGAIVTNLDRSRDDLMSGKLFQKMYVNVYKGFRSFYRVFGNVFAEVAGLLFGTLSTALPKLMSNLGTLFKPITFLLSKVGLNLQGPANFFGKIANFFNETGPFMNKALGFIEKAFGNKAGTIFLEAFEIGAKIGKILPFLAVIPTAIQTVIAAFGLLMKGDIKGAFKAIFVGFIKGFAAFFTFGLSDLILDFDKMFEMLSKPLDALFGVFKDVFLAINDIFQSVMVIVMGIWNDLLAPILNSLYTDALQPLGAALSSLGNMLTGVVAILFSVVATILKPFAFILRLIFKVIYETIKVLWEFVISPLLKNVAFIISMVFKSIGLVSTI
jgi:hypothetical protein